MRSDTLCLMDTALMVQPQANSAEGQAQSRSPEYNSGQVVQEQTGDSDRVVSSPRGI